MGCVCYSRGLISMGGIWEYVVSKIRCGGRKTRDKVGVTPDLMSTREVSDASSDTTTGRASEGYWLPLAASRSVQITERRKSVEDGGGQVMAMVPFTWEQGEIMQRLRSKALEICKYNGAHIRDNLRFDRLVRNTRNVPKKRAVALHPSIANMVDISKTTSVDSLPPDCERRRTRRRNTLASTVPVIYERDSKSRSHVS